MMIRARTYLSLAAAGLLALTSCKGDKPAAPATPAAKPAAAAAAKPAAKPATKAAKKKGAYEVITVAGGGTVTGKVTWKGAAPKVDPFPINKDTKDCDADGTGKRASGRLVVGAGGGVKNAVVYLDGVAKGKALLAKEGYTLDQKKCRYEPHVLVMPRGAKVSLKSSDEILHNVHMFGAANYNLPFPEAIAIEKSMRKKGVARLQCDAGHGWMSAHIHVVNHPYYALTGDDGSFTLGDVPAGKYTLKMWHEHWKVTETIEKDGAPAGYVFADAIEQSKPVEVTTGGTTQAAFELSAPGD